MPPASAIDATYQVDEIKDIRDKALAFEQYSRQAKNTEAERRACEIRLRAERKAGSLLAKMDKAKGKAGPGRGKAGNTAGPAFTDAPTLDELGVSKRQSADWQKLAQVPDETFEAALASPEKPTTASVIATVADVKIARMDDHALWLWGRLRDCERDGILDRDLSELLDAMTDAMRDDALRLIPLVRSWLEEVDDAGRRAA